jgi:hypothetical protein
MALLIAVLMQRRLIDAIELGKLSEVSAFLESADAHPTAVYHCPSAAL